MLLISLYRMDIGRDILLAQRYKSMESPQSLTFLFVMGALCVKLAKKKCQMENEKQKMPSYKPREIKSVSNRSTSEKENLSNHDLIMDKFNEIEKSIEKDLAMWQ